MFISGAVKSLIPVQSLKLILIESLETQPLALATSTQTFKDPVPIPVESTVIVCSVLPLYQRYDS